MLRSSFLAALLGAGCLATAAQTAVIDTTAGRMTCSLLAKERPATTAAFVKLAEGTPSVYDGMRIFPTSGGMAVGPRAAQGATFAAETMPESLFDRPGLLAMAVTKGQAGPARLLITDHGNAELDGSAVVFGQCDGATVKLVAGIRKTLQSTDNHPATAIAVDHIAIVRAGEALPPPAKAAGSVVPPLAGGALAPPSGPEPTGPNAVIETSAGTISCRLFTRESPVATSTFIGLVNGTKDWTDPRDHTLQHNHRFYDGMILDRVLPDYYIQFGDITGDISGDTDIGFRFRNENTPGLTFDRPGRLAFGNGGPDTNNSELFFSLNPMHALDGGFPIIGQCDAASVRVLERIARLPRDNRNLPLTPVVIKRVTVARE